MHCGASLNELQGALSLIYIAILGECNALWGEPERVAGCIISDIYSYTR